MKNLLVLFSLVFISHFSFGQVQLPSVGDTTRITITLINGSVYSGQLIDRNENEIMLMDGDQTHTLSIDEIEKVTKGQELRRVRITLKDGTERKGLLFKESDSEVAIKNENGQLFLDRDQIAKIERDYEKEFVRIRMQDGTVYEGYRNAEDKNSHTVHTSAGRVIYDPKKVVEIRVIDESKAEYFDYPYSTRYFFTPTAIPMRKGKRYYSNQYLLLNSFHYGLSDNVSIGVVLKSYRLYSR
jgi:small nuclear ribonucleoprotein (snRNP)-like protein